MSKATKRKHVVKEVLLDYVQPTPDQQIVKVLGSPGNNLHEVETPEGEKFLASMPTKFRKNIWIKRGDFLIVDPIAEGEKVKAEIAFIIYKDHQRLLQKEGLWPPSFNKEASETKTGNKEVVDEPPSANKSGAEDSGEDSGDDGDLFVNTNRVQYEDSEEETEESEDETDKEEESNEGDEGDQ